MKNYGTQMEEPLVMPDGESINDENGNEQIVFSTTTSAVNEITVKNAATGNSPQIKASGDDTNIDIEIIPKGSGVLNVSSLTASRGIVTDASKNVISDSAATGTGAPVRENSPTLITPALGTPASGALTNCTGLPIVGGTTGTLSVARGGTGTTSSTGTGSVVLNTSPTLVTPVLGTPTSGTLTNCTGLPIVAGTTGTLSVARGGTGTTSSTGTGDLVLSTSPTLVTPALGTPTSGNLINCSGVSIAGLTGILPVANGGTNSSAALNNSRVMVSSGGTIIESATITTTELGYLNGTTGTTGSGKIVLDTSPTLVTPVLGTPASGTLTNCTGLPIVAGTTGTLSVARGGTNSTTALNNSRVMVSSGGSIIESSTITTTELGYLNGVTGTTGSGKIVLDTSPTLVTPKLGTPASGVLTNCTGTASSLTAGSCSRTITAGNGLSGGGILTSDRTITLGTPSTLTSATTNALTATSHTHDITSGAISGTANQITVSGSPQALDGATTLSLPQNIHTSATPQFARMGLGTASSASYSITATGAINGTSYYVSGTRKDSNWDSAFSHISADGSSHSFINQNVTTTGTPTFSSVTWSGGSSANANSAFSHISANGSSHSFINQNVTTTGTPTFSSVTWSGGSSANANSAYSHISANGSSHSFINQNVTTTGTPQFTRIGLGAASSASYSLYATSSGSITIYGNNSGAGTAVYGSATSGVGLSGSATTGTAVYGSASSAGTAVYGSSPSGYGVRGVSTNSYGVYGQSTSVYGVIGTSDTSYGVYGQSTSNTGVYGSSTGGYGIYASSTNNIGIYARSTNSYAGYFSGSVVSTTGYMANGASTIQSSSSLTIPASDKFVISWASNTGIYYNHSQTRLETRWSNDDKHVFYSNGNFYAEGNISCGGTKAFDIKHPDPEKAEDGWRLVHSCIETPERGTNVYTYKVEVVNKEAKIVLPDYYKFLNDGDTEKIWISPVKHFGIAYGEINKEQTELIVTANSDGFYNVLIMCNRKDETYSADSEYNVEYRNDWSIEKASK